MIFVKLFLRNIVLSSIDLKVVDLIIGGVFFKGWMSWWIGELVLESFMLEELFKYL